MVDFHEVMSAASRREETVEVCVDGALNSTFEALERQLRGMDFRPSSLDSEDPRVEIAKEMEAVREQMRAHTFAFTFRGLPAKEWSDLLAAHPGREGVAEAWNQLTLPPELISRCAIDPTMTVDQVNELFQILNEGQRNLLFAGAWSANHGGDVPFSRTASGILGT